MFLFKKYSPLTGKGILIITNNEKSILNKLSGLKDKYYIVLHYNFNVGRIKHPNIDLNMMPKYNCQNIMDIPIATNVLIDPVFNYKENKVKDLINLLDKYKFDFIKNPSQKRYIDLLYVGRIVELKKTIDVLRYFSVFAKQGKKCIMLLLDQKQKEKAYIQSFYKYYDSLDDKVRTNILIIDTNKLNIKDNPMFFGFKMSDVALFYKNSKIYVHASENEGGSRSIHEAICSGCYCLIKNNMKGGGLDNIIDNATLYSDKTFESDFNTAFLKQKTYQCEERHIKNISSIYTLNILIDNLYSKLKYKCKKINFMNDCDLDYLQLKIAAHYFLVPWYDKKSLTTTINTEQKFDTFLKYIKSENTYSKFICHKDIEENVIEDIIKLKETFWPFPYESQIKWINNIFTDNDEHYVYYENGILKAYCCILHRNNHILDSVIIHPDYRKQGLGTKMVQEVITHIKKNIFLLCKKETISFYERLGWKINDDIRVYNKHIDDTLHKMSFNLTLDIIDYNPTNSTNTV